MRYLLLFFLILSTPVFAQSPFKFVSRHYDALDHWVVFPKEKDEQTYPFGFVYFEENEGFVCHYEGRVKVKGTQQMEVVSLQGGQQVIKVNLQTFSFLVAVLSEEQLAFLGLDAIPDWLSAYKVNQHSVSYQKSLGHYFNTSRASHLAIAPLFQAYLKAPYYDGLALELAFAYNATGQFEKAIPIMETAIDKECCNPYFFRELSSSYIGLNNLAKAEKVLKKGLLIAAKHATVKANLAAKMLIPYFKENDRERFDYWADITLKYASEGSLLVDHVNALKENWGKDIFNGV